MSTVRDVSNDISSLTLGTKGYGSRFVCHYAEGGATEAYCSRAVCHYAEGGATEAYCNRAVCQSVSPSFTSISRRSLKTKRQNKQHKQNSIFTRI